MDIGTVSNLTSQVAVSAGYTKTETSKTNSDGSTTTFSSLYAEVAVTYEKSSSSDETVDSSKIDYTKNSKVDTSAIVAQMKEDLNNRMSQLQSIVEQMMSKQGLTLAKADDIWSYLASGEFDNIDEAARAQAQEDISENGYWGVEQTSDRILDFAKALSGNDSSYAEELLEAFKKGFSQATEAWGTDLPDISQKTYDAVLEKFQKWIDGDEEET